MKIKLSEIIKDLRQLILKANLTEDDEKYFQYLQKILIEYATPKQLCEVAKEHIKGLNYSTFEDKIIKSKNSMLIYYYTVNNLPFADIKKMTNAIVELKDGYFNYLSARNIKGAPIEKHEKVVLEDGDPEINYLFLKYVFGANIEAHENVIRLSQNKVWIDKLNCQSDTPCPTLRQRLASQQKTSERIDII